MCVYVCMYVCTYVRTYVRRYVCMYIQVGRQIDRQIDRTNRQTDSQTDRQTNRQIDPMLIQDCFEGKSICSRRDILRMQMQKLPFLHSIDLIQPPPRRVHSPTPYLGPKASHHAWCKRNHCIKAWLPPGNMGRFMPNSLRPVLRTMSLALPA